ncbi:hypothetical protein KA005_68095, partial [bacterium]|nr:hypothetical protein [bacterium]
MSAILVLIVGVAAGLLCFPFFPERSKGLDVFLQWSLITVASFLVFTGIHPHNPTATHDFIKSGWHEERQLQAPSLPVLAVEELVGFRMVGEAHILGIPVEFSPGPDGHISQQDRLCQRTGIVEIGCSRFTSL